MFPPMSNTTDLQNASVAESSAAVRRQACRFGSYGSISRGMVTREDQAVIHTDRVTAPNPRIGENALLVRPMTLARSAFNRFNESEC